MAGQDVHVAQPDTNNGRKAHQKGDILRKQSDLRPDPFRSHDRPLPGYSYLSASMGLSAAAFLAG